MYVEERFHLPTEYKETLKQTPAPWGFGTFSEVIYYRTYSRTKEDGTQETWADTVIRVVEGVMSIRKDWYKKMHIAWDETQWTGLAKDLCDAIYTMKMLPPGRGLWAMGTDYIYERGGASLFNCAFVDIKDDLAGSMAWAMDMLMLGVGVGASTQNAAFKAPDYFNSYPTETIEDSREGWVNSVKRLLELPNSEFDYSAIRPQGTQLKGFGGLASGPGPLIELHKRIREYAYKYESYDKGYGSRTRYTADIINAIGACVVSGNIRRSAELLTGSITDNTFLNLKNYDLNPERSEIGWMSNNSVLLSNSDEFEALPKIANGIRNNGEPGIINLINIQKYGRVGKHKADAATGMNPCAEICLEDRELCNLVEVFPTRCKDLQEIWKTMQLATFYASTVSLLPTHDSSTNSVIMRNRRIGVSVSGVADWLDSTSLSTVTMALRKGYEDYVVPENKRLAREAGVPESIRVTTVKPSGTISLLAGVSPGMHWPVARFANRRVRISENSPLVPVLKKAGFFGEADAYSSNTLCFTFPLASGKGQTRAVREVSLWEQASLVAMLQREWADNSVSNTLTFRQSEESQVERVLAAFAPLVKSISMLPDQDEMTGDKKYAQPPFETITKEDYERQLTQVNSIDWRDLSGSDGIDERFCGNDTCEI